MPVPDLQLAPPPDRNALIPKLVIAAVVMIVVGVAVYFLNPRKTAEIKVDKVEIFAPHTVTKPAPGDGHIMGTAAESEDDVYAVATISITDKLRIPLLFDSASATLTTNGGSTSATVISPLDLPRLEQTFPEIAPLVNPPAAAPLQYQDTIEPGTTHTGTVLLLFPQTTEAAWKSKTSATLSIRLAHDTVPLQVALP